MAVHTFRHFDYVKEGINVVKANLGPSVVAMLGMCIPVANACVMVNYMKAVGDAKKSGRPIEIGPLFKFDNLVQNFIALLVRAILGCCCFVLGALLLFAMPIMADKPGTDAVNALKGAFAFGKQNLAGAIVLWLALALVPIVVIVPIVILMIVAGFIPMVGWILSLVLALLMFAALLVVMPIHMAAQYLAYDDARAAVEASAAEAGVRLV
jgi:hypothetical protein